MPAANAGSVPAARIRLLLLRQRGCAAKLAPSKGGRGRSSEPSSCRSPTAGLACDRDAEKFHPPLSCGCAAHGGLYLGVPILAIPSPRSAHYGDFRFTYCVGLSCCEPGAKASACPACPTRPADTPADWLSRICAVHCGSKRKRER